jgi:hypothetical protein
MVSMHGGTYMYTRPGYGVIWKLWDSSQSWRKKMMGDSLEEAREIAVGERKR